MANAKDSFGRKSLKHSCERPYHAVKVTGALFHTQGDLQLMEVAVSSTNENRFPDLLLPEVRRSSIGFGCGGYSVW